MPQTVNTNVSSLNAQRNLNTSQASLATSLQRLSSGLRINSAKDDAAGLAISQRFTTQIRGNEQAARNANDGISLAQTAEGDLEQIGNNLQRIRELAVQSSNASNSASDRQSINNEASQLIAEIDRVASASSFNGAKLLDGSFTAQTFQVGANNTANDRITVSSIASARSNALGVGSGSSYSTKLTGAVLSSGAALTDGGLTINGYNVGASAADGVSSKDATGSAIAKANAINAVSGQTGVTAKVNATTKTNTAGTAGGAFSINVNGVDVAGTTGTDATVNASTIAAAFNAVSNQTGVKATIDATDATKYVLTAADGRNIDIKAPAADAGPPVIIGPGDTGATTGTTYGSIDLSSNSAAGITLGGTQATAAIVGTAAGANAATVTAGAGVSSLDLTTAAGAQAALGTLDAAINTINTTRGELGAYQNRFESTISSLQSTTENLSASRGRITDTDFAKETANLTRSQILQQAGTAMLSQANQLSQGVLSLLR